MAHLKPECAKVQDIVSAQFKNCAGQSLADYFSNVEANLSRSRKGDQWDAFI